MLPSPRETAPPQSVWVCARLSAALPRPSWCTVSPLCPGLHPGPRGPQIRPWPCHGDPQTEPGAWQALLGIAGSQEGLEQHRGRGQRAADGEPQKAGPATPRALPEPRWLTDCHVLSAWSVFSKNRLFNVFIMQTPIFPSSINPDFFGPCVYVVAFSRASSVITSDNSLSVFDFRIRASKVVKVSLETLQPHPTGCDMNPLTVLHWFAPH